MRMELEQLKKSVEENPDDSSLQFELVSCFPTINLVPLLLVLLVSSANGIFFGTLILIAGFVSVG